MYRFLRDTLQHWLNHQYWSFVPKQEDCFSHWIRMCWEEALNDLLGTWLQALDASRESGIPSSVYWGFWEYPLCRDVHTRHTLSSSKISRDPSSWRPWIHQNLKWIARKSWQISGWMTVDTAANSWAATQFLGSSWWLCTLDSSHSPCLLLQQALQTAGRLLFITCLLSCLYAAVCYMTQLWKPLWVTIAHYCCNLVKECLCLMQQVPLPRPFCFFAVGFLTASTAMSV